MSITIYLIKSAVAMLLFLLLYIALFRRYTFFIFNRYYLLGSLVLSAILPLIQFRIQPLDQVGVSNYLTIDWNQFSYEPDPSGFSGATGHSFNLLSVFIVGYSIVTLFFIGRTVFRFYRFRKNYRDYRMIKNSGVRYFIHDGINAPFTVFRTIYLDQATYERTSGPMIRHEWVHARQLHSIDLLIVDLFCTFLWFNPFVFLFRQYIRDNHEYLADATAMHGNHHVVEYMQALSEELTRQTIPVYASNFNCSTIKKRIIMLTNRRSHKNKRWIYFLIIPVTGVLMMSFQKPLNDPILISNTETPMVASVAGSINTGPDAIPSRFPMNNSYKNAITLEFGWEGKNPVTGKMMHHKGVDIRATTGTAVYATGDGVVVKSEEREGYGKFIIIQHDEDFVSVYAHLDEQIVGEGEKVNKGEKIGAVGNTGYSTGPHLHYEVRRGEENLNPADYY